MWLSAAYLAAVGSVAKAETSVCDGSLGGRRLLMGRLLLNRLLLLLLGLLLLLLLNRLLLLLLLLDRLLLRLLRLLLDWLLLDSGGVDRLLLNGSGIGRNNGLAVGLVGTAEECDKQSDNNGYGGKYTGYFTDFAYIVGYFAERRTAAAQRDGNGQIAFGRCVQLNAKVVGQLCH